MEVELQIKNYTNSLPVAKSNDMRELRKFILQLLPDCKLWLPDDKNSEGKIISIQMQDTDCSSLNMQAVARKVFFRLA